MLAGDAAHQMPPILILAARERSYPQWNLGRYLSPAGRSAVAASQHDCLLDALIRNAGVDPSTWEAYPGSIFDNPEVNRRLASISPLHYSGTPREPMLFYHAVPDEFAPIGEMRRLATKYCREGRTVHVVTAPAGDHISYVLAGFPTALAYLRDRFVGTPAPDDC